MKKLLLFLICLISYNTYAQNISFTFVNARNTNDGVDDYYEADIYIASDTDFIVGSGQLYFNYNTEAFGENVHASGNFSMETPTDCILDTSFGGGFLEAYNLFIVNDNISSRVSTSFQQNASINAFNFSGVTSNVTSTPTHLYSIKIKYNDVTKDPNVSFEVGGTFLDQFYTACGPTTGSNSPDCTNHPGTQITGDSYDSTGASLFSDVNWTGASSAFWSITSNWNTSAIPSTSNNVTIPDVANDPILNTGNLSVNDLTIDSGADLTVDVNGALTVNGDLNNSGTIALTASASNSSVFIVEGSASGQVTFQQNGLLANQWNVITAPVSGQSIKDFAENAANDIRINNTVSPSRYAIAYYDDSNADGAKWVYYTTTDLSSGTLTFELGKSYAISRATDGSVSFTGTIETNDVTETVAADQWNAIGNPYTAYMPINENSGANFIQDNFAKFNSSFVAVYTWDASQNKYTAQTLADAESKLAPGQGFFIRTNTGVGNVAFNKVQRGLDVSGGASTRLVTTNSNTEIKLSIASDATKVSTRILYSETATKGLDAGYDVGNFGGADLDVYSKLIEGNTEDNFTIQSLPISNYEEIIVPVGVVAEAGKEIVFSVEMNNLPSDSNIYLEDKLTNTYTDLTEGGFTVKVEEKLNGAGRFYLHTSAKVLSTDDEIINNETVSIFKSTKSEITITGVTSNANVKVYSILGKEVATTTIEGNQTSKINLNNLSSGIYIVKLQSETSEISKKIILE
ncbi:T9SS type A sorting domain-containing protein [uncultured Tenacibaculum sp.]|uniref:T9SS type A sorting domain-containing protein n=1 Tax=uncultured Tenacibaculum sp. TaxID=174713 RepID=UPI00263692CA|nr:T9SS type A sorting domain-containing protein [uncultured Tenacibaculum sp.]